MKKIAIIGATGRTGKHLVEQVARQNYIPVCLERESSEYNSIKVEPISIIGTPLNYDDVFKALDGCFTVLCALNISRKSDAPWAKVISPANLLEESMKNIAKAMKEHGIKRVITVSAWGVGDSYNEVNWMFRLLINKTNVGVAYNGHEKQERVLQESELDWTAVRPVGLSNEKVSRPTRVSLNGDKKLKMMISRKDVAKFMLDIIDKEMYYRTFPSISND